MKGRDRRLGDGQTADQRFDAFSHLRGSLVGKGNGKNGFGHRAEVLDQMSNAISNDTCLATTGARQDKHRPAGGLNSFALLRVELGEKRQRWQRLRELLAGFYRTHRARLTNQQMQSGSLAPSDSESACKKWRGER